MGYLPLRCFTKMQYYILPIFYIFNYILWYYLISIYTIEILPNVSYRPNSFFRQWLYKIARYDYAIVFTSILTNRNSLFSVFTNTLWLFLFIYLYLLVHLFQEGRFSQSISIKFIHAKNHFSSILSSTLWYFFILKSLFWLVIQLGLVFYIW